MRSRGLAIGLICAALLAGCSPAATKTGESRSLSPSPSPTTSYDASKVTLGWTWNSNVEGFGTVRPGTIFNGGDPSGWVIKVKWRTWGTPVATGTGQGWWVPPDKAIGDGHHEPVVVVAWDVGPCHGLTAYRRVGWYFPTKGENFDPQTTVDSFNLCVDQQKLPMWEM